MMDANERLGFNFSPIEHIYVMEINEKVRYELRNDAEAILWNEVSDIVKWEYARPLKHVTYRKLGN